MLTRREARAYLLGQLGLNRIREERGAAGSRAVLDRLRCIQLDPLDPMGTNADLVVQARVDGVRRGDLHAHNAGAAFEHFAKERCLLPARAFPYYRDQAAATPWWRLTERLKRLPDGVLDAVLHEVAERGPLTAADMSDHGRVRPMDWSGWKGTSKAASMALEVLWTRCKVVVSGRRNGARVYDLPERALGDIAARPGADFERWALLERVEAAGLLARASGPHWSMLSAARTGPVPDQLIAEGLLAEVRVEGSSRPYLAPADFRDRRFPEPDDRMRILGPLDPLLWDRKLVRQVFDFEYIWEVYKPAAQRRWGWYVMPLLHRGRLVGRLEGRVDGDLLRIDRLWPEDGRRLSRSALRRALKRHARLCGVERIVLEGAPLR